MKKLLVAAIALTLSASAFADWEVVEQNDQSVTFADKDLGIAMNVTAAGKSGSAPIKDVAESFVIMHQQQRYSRDDRNQKDCSLRKP